MCLLLCYVSWAAGTPNGILIGAVALTLLSKLYFLQNRLRKIDLIQSVLIHKYHGVS